MTTERFKATKQGVKGICERITTKGPRPADKSGWDLYECQDRRWEQERFTPTNNPMKESENVK